MSFIRPSAAKFLKTYGEVIAGKLIALIGLWNIFATGWVIQGLGVVCFITGMAISITALRRTRFPKASGGPGVVEVDERQISYFSAFAGGTVSLEALGCISIVTNDDGPWGEDMVWTFEEDGGTTLHIPASASNVEALFDAFAALSGVNYDAVSDASRSTENRTYLVWSKERAQLH